MARMTGGQALVRSVLAHGVDTLYALPGVQLDAFFNALHDAGEAIRVINTRHEQGAAYMAMGHALATGGVGAFAVVPGPGVLNTLAALSTAYATNARVLCLTGQIPSYAIGRGFGLLHEIPEQLAMLRGLTKWAERIEHLSEAPAKVEEAFRQLASGRPRPVALEMAPDRLFEEGDVRLSEPVPEDTQPQVDAELIEQAAELLAQAQAPAIFVGGGALGAEAELRALAEHLQAPVVAYRTGRGIVPDDHPLACNMVGGQRLWAEADVVLGVGTRLQHARQVWGTDERLKVIHINIDPTELNRIERPTVAIAADAKAALAALLPAVERRGGPRNDRGESLAAIKAEAAEKVQRTLAPQLEWVQALRAALDRDGILVDELTQVGYAGRLAWPVYAPRTYISTGYQGTLGAGLATAIGVKVARPEVQVLSINGDGGFMYNVQELATAVKYRIPVVAVVFNDNAYGNVKRMQQELYGGRVIASDLTNPDFVRLAESFGAAGYRAETPERLQAVLGEAFAQGGPAVVEVPMGPVPDPWGLIYGGRVRGRSGQ